LYHGAPELGVASAREGAAALAGGREPAEARGRGAGIVALHEDLHEQRVAPERRQVGRAPLDEQHGPVGAALAQAELGELLGITEAVEIGVDDGQAAVVLVDEREGGAGDGDRVRDAERAAEGAAEEGLARAEIALEEDEIAALERAGEAAGELDRRAARGEREVGGQLGARSQKRYAAPALIPISTIDPLAEGTQRRLPSCASSWIEGLSA
jgi:hypothetical protein